MITIHHVRSILEQCETPQEVLSLNDPDGYIGREFKSMADTLRVVGFLGCKVFKPRAVGHSWDHTSPLMYETTDAGREWLSANRDRNR